jgi:hypothetical protein
MATPSIETLASEIQDLKRRMGIMEGAPQLGYSSISQGALQIANDAGVVQIRLGETSLGSGKYGFVVGVDEDIPAMALDDVDGMTYPHLPVPFVNSVSYDAMTFSPYTSVWSGRMSQVSHKGLAVQTRVTVPGGTSGTIGLKATWPGGSATSSTRALVGAGGGAINTNTFYWLHGCPIGQITGTQVAIFQMLLTMTGAGPIQISPPDFAFLIGPEHCSAAGTYVP